MRRVTCVLGVAAAALVFAAATLAAEPW